MESYNESIEINQSPNGPYIPVNLYNILIIGGSRSGKTYVLLNLRKHQKLDIDKIYFTSQIHLNQV